MDGCEALDVRVAKLIEFATLAIEMKTVCIKKNANLQKDNDENFWLLIESASGPAAFNLTAVTADKLT